MSDGSPRACAGFLLQGRVCAAIAKGRPHMSQYDFLSALVSIVIALGLSHLLTGVTRLISHRGRYRPHCPSLDWAATLFLLQVQIW